MANIDHYLEEIEVASRGEEVRDSIIDAFKTLNSEGPGTMAWNNITGTPDTLTGYGVSEVPASMVSGVLALNNIPPSALERVVPVANDTARFALTLSDVQNGDTVKVLSTQKLYLVVDDTSLSTEAGYEEYRAGTADSVDWSGVLNTPDTLAGYGIEDAYTKDEVDDITTSELAPILGNFASAETSPTSASHAVGEYLLYNNRLYKVLAAISAGQQLTIGTNIGQTNVAAELASQASAISALNSNLQKSVYYTDAQVSSLGGLKACVQDTVTNAKVTDGVFLGDFTAKTRYLMIGMLYNTRQYGTILLYSFGNSTSYRAKVSGGTVSLRQFTETDVS